MVRSDPKVFRRGEPDDPWVFGFCGSFRVGQLLRWSLELPTPEGDDLDRFMVTTFVDAVRSCLKVGGGAHREHEVETPGDGAFLVGYRGRLFGVLNDYQVAAARDGLMAMGCGGDLALGALHASRGSARTRIMRALEAAEAYCAGVRGPFTVESIRW